MIVTKFSLIIFIAFHLSFVISQEEDEEEECSNHAAFNSLHSCINECRSSKDVISSFVSAAGQLHKIINLSTKHLSPEMTSKAYVLKNDNTTTIMCYPLDYDFIKCKKWALEDDEFVMSEDSLDLVVLHESKNETIPTGKFYLDYDEAVVCTEQPNIETENEDNWFLAAHFVSAFSLVVVLICAIKFRELKLRQNYVLLCHMGTLSVAFWTLVIEDFAVRRSQTATSSVSGCLAIAFVKQFAFLASFFWINVQAIDLYVRFNSLCVNGARTSKRRFLFYSAIAWGLPLILSCITLILERSKNVPLLFRPKFNSFCWFAPKPKLAAFLYFYGPIAIILLSNFVLFTLTVIKLRNVGKEVSGVNKTICKQLLQLCTKLFVVMGLCWIMEVISWGVGGPEHHWYFTDFVNALQGFFIFLIYIFKPVYFKRVLRSKCSYFAKRFPIKEQRHSTGSTNVRKEHSTQQLEESAV